MSSPDGARAAVTCPVVASIGMAVAPRRPCAQGPPAGGCQRLHRHERVPASGHRVSSHPKGTIGKNGSPDGWSVFVAGALSGSPAAGAVHSSRPMPSSAIPHSRGSPPATAAEPNATPAINAIAATINRASRATRYIGVITCPFFAIRGVRSHAGTPTCRMIGLFVACRPICAIPLRGTAGNAGRTAPTVGKIGLVVPYSRYVALGDSFTEGIGDPHPNSRNGQNAIPTSVMPISQSAVAR